MFARLSTLVLAIAACAVAVPVPDDASSQCDTGNIQCCDTVQTASTASSMFGIIIPVEGLVGLNCSPISVLGIGSGADCAQQPVCCSNVSQSGVINFGCSPVNLST